MKETGVALAGNEVVIENGVVDAPDGIVTDAGTEATPGFELSREMVTPPDGAGPFRKAVPFTLVPPWIDAGTFIPASDGGKTPDPWLLVEALP